MRCPYCKSDNDRVIDSRASADGFAIRRRRQCSDCSRRYTTYERVETAPLRVVKKSGERAAFDRAKILAGVTRACEKRPVSSEALEELVDRIEHECMEAFDKEVPTKVIGNLVMRELRETDQVAYVRFASVYREFKDVGQFLEELKPMLEKHGFEKAGFEHDGPRRDAGPARDGRHGSAGHEHAEDAAVRQRPPTREGIDGEAAGGVVG